jgi:thiopurine S-methyltransferase
VEYWSARWREGRTGFHEGRANAFLEKHIARLGERRRVLVPLCGKAEDMVFLAAHGHEVVGIEAVEEPVKAFFEEHALSPNVHEGPHGRVYSANNITILISDVLACTREDVGEVNALYDRAAVFALADDVRPKYVAHLRALLKPHSTGLVITFEYPPEKLDGPPFSVGVDEIRTLYAGAAVFEEIDVADAVVGPKFREAGVSATERCVFLSL